MQDVVNDYFENRLKAKTEALAQRSKKAELPGKISVESLPKLLFLNNQDPQKYTL
jgi:hypothetical protein